MPISTPRIIKCKICKKKFPVLIGDVRPQRIVCPHCNYEWLFMKDRIVLIMKSSLAEPMPG